MIVCASCVTVAVAVTVCASGTNSMEFVGSGDGVIIMRLFDDDDAAADATDDAVDGDDEAVGIDDAAADAPTTAGEVDSGCDVPMGTPLESTETVNVTAVDVIVVVPVTCVWWWCCSAVVIVGDALDVPVG